MEVLAFVRLSRLRIEDQLKERDLPPALIRDVRGLANGEEAVRPPKLSRGRVGFKGEGECTKSGEG
jgi:hypothetical protein